MNQNIHTHLEKLKVELDRLEPAVKHLQKADENATALINTFSTIHEEFKKHLQNIENAISDNNQAHLKQINKEFDSSINKLKEIYVKVKDSNDAFVSSILELLSDYNKLQTATSSLIFKIDGVDFPKRLTKLDAAVDSINNELLNIQIRISDFEQNVNDSIKTKTTELNSNITTFESNQKLRIEKFEKSVSEQFLKQTKENNLLKILLFVSIALTLGLIFYKLFFE